MVAVREYERTDGTRVRAHTRWAPGARNEMFKMAMFVLAVVVIGGRNGTTAKTGGGGPQRLPQPKPAAVYPVKLPGSDDKPAPRPTPTVSYPIPWNRDSR